MAMERADDAADGASPGDSGVDESEVQHGAVRATEETGVSEVGNVDGEIANGVSVAVEDSGEGLVVVSADGREVGDGAHIDVGAEAEVGVGEVCAGVHLGGEQLQALGRGDDIGALGGGAVVVGAGLPVRGVVGGRGNGGRHGGVGVVEREYRSVRKA